MKASWGIISVGLDQLFFSPLLEDETAESRDETIVKFLTANGWTWDDVLDRMAEEDGHGRSV